MIDYEKIIQDTCIPNGNYTVVFLKSELLKCMKRAVAEAVPITLQFTADKVVEEQKTQGIHARILNYESEILEKLVPLNS